MEEGPTSVNIASVMSQSAWTALKPVTNMGLSDEYLLHLDPNNDWKPQIWPIISIPRSQ